MQAGIPYFPLDTQLDTKLKLIVAEFGLTGLGVVVRLFQMIYGGEGYYIGWSDEVALMFAAEARLGGGAVSEIVSAAIRRGIFDKALYDKYQILTSRGIQKRYFEAVKRRKKAECEKAYLLLDVSDLGENVCKNTKIACRNTKIACNLQQSKEEESRGKKSKEEWREQVAQRGFSQELEQSVFEWLAYKTERKESYKPTGLKSLLTEIDNNAKKHGDRAVCDLIRKCMASGWKGIIFDKLIQNQGKNAMPAASDNGSSDWDFYKTDPSEWKEE